MTTKIKLTDGISLTFYLMATGKRDRIQRSVWIERIYYDILKKQNINISDLINYLLEFYLKEIGYLDIKEYI